MSNTNELEDLPKNSEVSFSLTQFQLLESIVDRGNLQKQ